MIGTSFSVTPAMRWIPPRNTTAASTAASTASQGFQPMLTHRAATAPPVAREPSTVRSATSNIL